MLQQEISVLQIMYVYSCVELISNLAVRPMS